jgi:hypothetical protein
VFDLWHSLTVQITDKRMKNIILTAVAVASVQKWSKEHKGPSLLCKCPR